MDSIEMLHVAEFVVISLLTNAFIILASAFFLILVYSLWDDKRGLIETMTANVLIFLGGMVSIYIVGMASSVDMTYSQSFMMNCLFFLSRGSLLMINRILFNRYFYRKRSE